MFRQPTLLRQFRVLNTNQHLLHHHRNVLRQPFTSSSAAYARPRRAPLKRYAPPAADTPPPPPPPEALYAEPPPPGRNRYPGKSLIWTFFVLSVASTLVGQFPNRVLPPVPDPPSLHPYSKTPLTSSFVVSNPVVATQLFVFRLRRGEYFGYWRMFMTFQPFLYVLEDTPTLYPTWLTHLFTHGSVFHWLFCFLALRSIVPGMCVRFGTGRTAAFLTMSGVGAAAAENMYIDYKLHEKVNREPPTGLLDKAWQLMGTGSAAHDRTVRAGAKLQNLTEEEKRELLNARLGSSAALMAGMVVTAIEMPATEWMLMFIPIGIPARVMLGMLVAFDAVGAFGYDYGWGIDHKGHLAGDVMGALLYMVWLRRVKWPGKWKLGGA